MKLLTTLLLLSITTAFVAPALAADEIQCRPDGNQQEMNACAVRDFKVADAALNEKYKAALAALSPAQQNALRQQQRAWLKKRDPSCKARVKGSEGGSIWALEFYACLESSTRQRTEALGQWQARP